SFNDGAAWQSLRLDLPVTPVHGIEVKGDDLVIATHGRSFYIMDDISVLRQVTRTTGTAPVFLFKPLDAARFVWVGLLIDYFLKAAADKLTVDILDARGSVIRTFTGRSGDQKETTPVAAADSGDDNQRPPAPRPSVKQGMSRFTWDMRFPNAKDFPGLIMWAGSTRGPQAPPGRYSVRLTANG